MTFDRFDNVIEQRKTTHERFHSNCKMEKRNTTEGKVNWIIMENKK